MYAKRDFKGRIYISGRHQNGKEAPFEGSIFAHSVSYEINMRFRFIAKKGLSCCGIVCFAWGCIIEVRVSLRLMKIMYFRMRVFNNVIFEIISSKIQKIFYDNENSALLDKIFSEILRGTIML